MELNEESVDGTQTNQKDGGKKVECSNINPTIHPCSVYMKVPNVNNYDKTTPEYKKLKEFFPSGCIHGKDSEGLHVLSEFLLDKDFGLNVKISKDSSQTTMPLCYNHILWIEDLINFSPQERKVKKLVDLETEPGIYPLILAKRNGWSFIATESDEKKFALTQDNIKKNKMEKKILSVKADISAAVTLMKSSGSKFDVVNLNNKHLTVKGATMLEVELLTNFLQQIQLIKTDVRFFTTMISSKKVLQHLTQEFMKCDIRFFEAKSFHLSSVRASLAVAWSFFENIPNPELKSNESMQFSISQPPGNTILIIGLIAKLKILFSEMNVQYQIQQQKLNNIEFVLHSKEVLWSNDLKWDEIGKRKANDDKGGNKKNKKNNNPLNSLLKVPDNQNILMEDDYVNFSPLVPHSVKNQSNLVDEWFDDSVNNELKYSLFCELFLKKKGKQNWTVSLNSLEGGDPHNTEMLYHFLSNIMPKDTVTVKPRYNTVLGNQTPIISEVS